jgi:hypothetical protein
MLICKLHGNADRRHSTDFSVCNLNQNGVKRNEIDIDLLQV